MDQIGQKYQSGLSEQKYYANVTEQKRNNNKCYTLAFRYYIAISYRLEIDNCFHTR